MKKKRLHRLLLLMVLLLAACQGQVPEGATETAPAPEAPAPQSPEPSPVPPTQNEDTETALEEGTAPPGCTVVSAAPTPGPTEQSLFPPVGDTDWVRGSEAADITIIEYSDFQ